MSKKTESYTIANVLQGKSAKAKQRILKDKLITQIYVCLYLCPGNCADDPTCPWKEKQNEQTRKTET